jgi:hypothetical protein
MLLSGMLPHDVTAVAVCLLAIWWISEFGATRVTAIWAISAFGTLVVVCWVATHFAQMRIRLSNLFQVQVFVSRPAQRR